MFNKFFTKAVLTELQEALGVQVADLLFISRADGGVIQECAAQGIAAVGIIDREYDAIDANGLQGEQEWWIGEEAAGRNVEVLQKVVGYFALQIFCCWRERVIDASQHKRDHFSHVPDDDLQVWQMIKYSGQDQAQRVNA